jgi:Xaa-Pro aminopeptidase
MQKMRLDCLFLTGEENYHYFTGGADLSLYRSFTRPHVVIVPLDGEPIAIDSKGHSIILRMAGAVEDIRTYTSVFGIPAEVLIKAVKEVCFRYNRIGAEFGLEQRLGIPYRDLQTLVQAFRGIKFVDASDLLWKLRMVKSQKEIELMRMACTITGKARQRTFGEIGAGMTERDVARIFSRNMLQEGADRVAFVHASSNDPINHTYLCRNTKLGIGDTLYLDGGAYYWTYTCDYSRMATIGKASAGQIKAHKIVTRVGQRMAEALKAGLRCSALFKIGVKAFRELGVKGVLAETAGRMGHGQGMMVTEPPSISADNESILEPGMVISIEPGFDTDFGTFIWEEIYVVREGGHEQLSVEPEDLRRI